ncbi:MAG: hypothetical protein ACR2GY_09470, partial [Phycisphaerales bacterium]
MQLHDEPPIAGGAIEFRLAMFVFMVQALGWICLSGVWITLSQQPSSAQPPVASPPRQRVLPAATAILAVALIARIIVLLWSQPSYSDDIWRYIFDGRNTVNGINPYEVVPVDIRDEQVLDVTGALQQKPWPGRAAIARRMNNPELSTIYLPASQYAFAVAGALCEIALTESQAAPERCATIFRGEMVVADMVLILFILLLLHRRECSLWWAVLYAWHPLPLVEIAGSGHQDVFGIVLIALALLVARRLQSQPQRSGNDSGNTRPAAVTRTAFWACCVACATLIKPFAAICGIMLLRRQSARHWAIAILSGIIVISAMSAPFFVGSETATSNLYTTATRFSLKWAHFGPVYEPVLAGIDYLTNDPDMHYASPERYPWSNDAQERLARGICIIIGLFALGVVWL